MEYSKALGIAENIVEQLAPYCERIQIAGSIRRKKPEVGDIEIVCISKKGNQRSSKTGLFAPVMGFITTVNQWAKVRGEAWDKATNRRLPEGIALDLFTAVEDNWGYILAIRTGSAEYSHKVLATGWVKKGFHGKEGFLYTKDDGLVPVCEEEDLFRLIGIPFEKPENRNL